MFSQKKGAWGNVPSIILTHDYTGLTQYLRGNFPGIAKSFRPIYRFPIYRWGKIKNRATAKGKKRPMGIKI